MQEIWKDVKGYEGLYQASNFGNIKSLYKHNGTNYRILKPRINRQGYYQVGLYKPSQKHPTTFTVHKIIGLTFISNKNNYTQINHLDGNKLNNHVNNLEWCDAKINNLHRIYELKHNGGLPKPKSVKCVETNSIYRSIREAEYTNNINAIYKVLDNQNRTAGGFHWVSV